VAALVTIWLTAVICKIATGTVPSLLTISAVVLTVQTAVVLATGELTGSSCCNSRSRTCACASCSPGRRAAETRLSPGWPPRRRAAASRPPLTRPAPLLPAGHLAVGGDLPAALVPAMMVAK
jgi:hypothetical protein